MSPKSNFALNWNESADLAFIESKQILANAVGGVLQQCVDNVWQPLSFFSKKLFPAETRYSAFDRELLAIYGTIRHFRHILEGRNFFVNTEHKPLTFVVTSAIERPSLRQSLAYIAEFTTDFRYVEGETNFVADALSRPSVTAIGSASVISCTELSKVQALYAEFTRSHHLTSSTFDFQLLKSFDKNLIWCDVSTGHARPYTTAKFRRKVFMSPHGLGQSHRATKPLINTRPPGERSTRQFTKTRVVSQTKER